MASVSSARPSALPVTVTACGSGGADSKAELVAAIAAALPISSAPTQASANAPRRSSLSAYPCLSIVSFVPHLEVVSQAGTIDATQGVVQQRIDIDSRIGLGSRHGIPV